MLALLKLLQSLVKTLHSDGTPGQIAAGMTLGTALGLMPLVSLQTFFIFCLLFVLNVSFGAALLAWAIATPVGFLLDPLFDALGRALLERAALRGFWTACANFPLVPLTNFNNSVTLGSLVVWALLSIPMYLAFRFLVVRYRDSLGARVQRSALYQVISASQAYNVYRWFKPE